MVLRPPPGGPVKRGRGVGERRVWWWGVGQAPGVGGWLAGLRGAEGYALQARGSASGGCGAGRRAEGGTGYILLFYYTTILCYFIRRARTARRDEGRVLHLLKEKLLQVVEAALRERLPHQLDRRLCAVPGCMGRARWAMPRAGLLGSPPQRYFGHLGSSPLSICPLSSPQRYCGAQRRIHGRCELSVLLERGFVGIL